MKAAFLNLWGEFCFTFLKRHMPERLELHIQERGRAIAQETAMKVAMEFLHRQGFLTCAVCPQRHGLQYASVNMDGDIKRMMLCMTHHSQAVAEPAQN